MLAKGLDQRPTAVAAAGSLGELLPSLAGIPALPRHDAPPGGPARPYTWQHDTPGSPIRTGGETVVLARSAVEAPHPPPAAAPRPGLPRQRAWLLGAVGGGVLLVGGVLVQMPPGSVQNLSYEASTKAARANGSPRARLAALVVDQQREEAVYAAQARITIRTLHSLAVAPATVTMAPGDTQPIAVTATFDDGTPAPAEAFKPVFVSSNPAAASIDEQGTIRATGIGGAVIRVSVGSVSADVPVSVTARSPASPSQRPLP